MIITNPAMAIWQVLKASLGIIIGAIAGTIGSVVLMLPLNLCCYFWAPYLYLTAPCGAIGGAIIGCGMGLSKPLENRWAGFGGAVAVVIPLVLLGAIGLLNLCYGAAQPTLENVVASIILIPIAVAFGAAAGAIGGASARWLMTQPAWQWKQ